MNSGRLLERLRAVISFDLRSLALYRVALGLLVFGDALSRARIATAGFSDAGILPRDLIAAPYPYLAGPFASGEPLFVVFWLTLLASAGMFLTLGFHTRIATAACWLLLASIQLRNPIFLDGGDDLLRMQLLWALFLPLGARFAFDASARGPGRVANLATAALTLQFIVFYFTAGFRKSAPEWVGDGNAIAMVLQNEYWARPLASVLLKFPDALYALSIATPWIEMLVPLLLLVPWHNTAWRCVALGVLWGFQAGLGTSIELSLFPWISTAASFVFLPPALWRCFGARSKAAPSTAEPEPEPEPAGADTDRLAAGGAGTAQAPNEIPALPRAAQVLLVIGIALTLAMTQRPIYTRIGIPLRDGLGFQQYWAMYAPFAPRRDIQVALGGVLADGRLVDLRGTPPTEAWAELLGQLDTYRMKDYAERLARREDFDLERFHYTRWLCREWQQRVGQPALAELRFIRRSRKISSFPSGERAPVNSSLLLAIRCP